MVDFEKLRIFYHVAKQGSFKDALACLGKNHSTVSKHILDLETNLNTKLFVRHRRGLELTETGKNLFKVAQRTIPDLEMATLEISGETKQDSLTIITTTGHACIWLTKKIARFIKMNPEIKIRVLTTNEEVDFANCKADIGILTRHPNPVGITQQKLYTNYLKLYASSEYLKKNGTPKTFEDLKKHKLISFYPDLMGYRGNVDWHLQALEGQEEGNQVVLAINSAFCLMEAAALGLGITTFPLGLPHMDKYDLVNVLPEEEFRIDTYFVTRSNQRKTALIQQCYESLVEDID